MDKRRQTNDVQGNMGRGDQGHRRLCGVSVENRSRQWEEMHMYE